MAVRLRRSPSRRASRADAFSSSGPAEMRSVGEVEAVRAIADDCLTRFPGKTKVAAGIVGYADLTLADRVEPVLAALAQAGGGRFRGVRNSAGFHPDPVIGNNHHGATAGHYLRKDFQAYFRTGFSTD